MVPTCSTARSAFCTSGRPIEIWLAPARWISGSETPRASVRLRIVSIASSIACGVTSGTFGVWLALVDELDAAAQVQAELAWASWR